ncbi:23853_t:CDS:2, partial [Racocetra persica]
LYSLRKLPQKQELPPKELSAKNQKYKIEDECDEIFDNDENCICFFCLEKSSVLTIKVNYNKKKIEELQKEVTKKTNISVFEEMLQEDNETQKEMFAKNDFDINSYHDTIRDILTRKQKSKVWDWVQEYINNSDKLDRYLNTKS